jgi:glycosyltransferase involved in cell wall biosynthesis
LLGVLVTYRRPEALADTLGRIRAQTLRPDRLLVVDNGGGADVRDVVDRAAAAGLAAVYVDAGENLGPAGGFALGMEQLLADAGDDDWVFLFDDDDPPFFDDAIENAARFGAAMVATDSATGAVGISGGRFDIDRGRVLRIGDAEIHDAVPVDHITGGGLPAYRVAAIRQVGVFRRELFFGFEELEYGLRLTRAGFHLYADGEQWKHRKRVKREQGLLPSEEESANRAATPGLRLTSDSWRRYYSLRNLVFILREMGADAAAARVALGRGVLKPLANLPLSPRLGWRALRSGVGAALDGWRGRMGRSVEPEVA